MKKFSLILTVLPMIMAALWMDGVRAVIHADEKAPPDQSFVVNVSKILHEDDLIVTQVEIEAQPGTIIEVISDRPNRGGVVAASPEPSELDRTPRTRLMLFGDNVVWE